MFPVFWERLDIGTSVPLVSEKKGLIRQARWQPRWRSAGGGWLCRVATG